MRRMIPAIFSAVVLGMAFATAAPAHDAADQQVSEQQTGRRAIEAIILDQDRAWNNGDAKSYVQRMLPEANFTNIVGNFFPNRDAFMSNMSDLFVGLFKGSTNHQTVQSVRFIAPGVAVVDTISALSGFARPPVGAEAINGVMHSRPEMVMVKRSDGWWIASFHNVTINPRFLPAERATPSK